MNKVVSHSLFTDFDIDLFKSGKHYKLHEKMGAHCIELNGVSGVYFAVWAPAAQSVSVVGNFNFWNAEEHPLNVRWDSSGIWEGFIPGLDQGEVYKYSISSEFTQGAVQKADPFARCLRRSNFGVRSAFGFLEKRGGMENAELYPNG